MSWKYFLWGEEREAQEIYTEHAKKRALQLQPARLCPREAQRPKPFIS